MEDNYQIRYWLVEVYNEISQTWDPDQDYYIETQAKGRCAFWESSVCKARYRMLWREPTRAEIYIRSLARQEAFRDCMDAIEALRVMPREDR